MKNNTFKRIVAAIAAVSVISTASINVSATTKEDVVAAARDAGFMEVYVQDLQNWLNGNRFSSDQYDSLIDNLYNAGEEMDEIALSIWDVTVDEMKEKKEEEAEEKGTDIDDSWLVEIAENMTEENITNILDDMVTAGEEMGLDVTFEQKGEMEYILTIKNKDGNIQLVTPIGKLVDRTGITVTDDAALSSTLSCVKAVGLTISFYL